MSSYPVQAYPSPRPFMSFEEFTGFFAQAEKWHYPPEWDHFETRATRAEYCLWILQEPKRWLLDRLPLDQAINVLDVLPRPSGDSRLPMELRLEIAGAELNVFEQVFEPLLSGSPHESTARLGSICFMWWELGGWEDPALAAIFRETFEKLLSSPCRSILHSALHGLGHHIGLTSDPLAVKLIDGFLLAHPNEDAELTSYARAARVGNVL